jgi:hypothetical protein
MIDQLPTLCQIQRFELAWESTDYPHLNRFQFDEFVTGEIHKFIDRMAALKCEFKALQNVGPMGVNCKFYDIAGTNAVRQMMTYNPKTKGIYVAVDCECILAPPLEGEKKPVTNDGEDTPEDPTIMNAAGMVH